MELNPPNREANRTVKAAVNGCDQRRCHKAAAADPDWSFSRHRRTVVEHVWECNPQEFPTALELTTVRNFSWRSKGTPAIGPFGRFKLPFSVENFEVEVE